MAAPMDVPGGRIVVAQDSQGAVFAIFSGGFDD
jgi:predicted enzyme related to lactoylglutathione lyase